MSMFRRSTMLLLTLASAATLMAAAGPPWIAIEYPANPHDPETRGALMVVRTYHHESAVGAEISARALATVDGRRVTVALRVRETSRPGVYAIRGALPGTGASVVTVTRGSGSDGATALVAMNQHGEILAVQVPHRTVENGRWVVPRAPTADEVEMLLRTASAMDAAASSARLAAGAGVALFLLLAVPSGAWLARRRRAR
ncbi:MAG TPA: hypothetical protein VMM12_03365 [Longimicrobiales bacterium]|nr:hypothetical protein [Longimicrobiales bacterium]